MPIRAHKPAVRPEGWDDAEWIFPQRLEEIASALTLSRQQIADLAGTSAASVTRWLHYTNKAGLVYAAKIERGLGLAAGTLTRSILTDTPRPPESSVRKSERTPEPPNS